MNVLFVLYGSFECVNSATHIFRLATELTARGHGASIAALGDVALVSLIGTPSFSCVSHEDALNGKFGFPDGRGPDLIHAWTPRERVRQLVTRLSGWLKVPYVVHLEDNEEEITANHTGRGMGALRRMSRAELDSIIPVDISHPVRYREFLDGASGITVIVDELLRFCDPSIPSQVLWAGFEPEFEHLPAGNPQMRRWFGIGDDETVLFYPGNCHSSNRAEIASLYLAVALLNENGFNVRFVRMGTDHVDPFEGDDRSFVRRHCIELGFRPRSAVAGPLAMADVLVQPGKPGPFNDCRLPSKLPEFLVSGRPVVLPKSNVGQYLTDKVNCVHLRDGNGADIAACVEYLIRDRAAATRIGHAGREFALAHLNWFTICDRVLVLYDAVRAEAAEFHVSGCAMAAVAAEGSTHRTALDVPPRDRSPRRKEIPSMPPVSHEQIMARYSMTRPYPVLGFATARDYSDSYDHLHPLATALSDLKDYQRPWVLKAVLGHIPRGSSILEIGAGEPVVAGLLNELGYQVTVVDPYEGYANGPRDYDEYRTRLPNVRFIRSLFHEGLLPENEKFDGIISISVLEHVPLDDLPGLVRGIRRHLNPGGYSIHAVDWVLRGQLADWHQSVAQTLAREMGVNPKDVDELREEALQSTETCLLSAHAHAMWRGSQAYDEFPFRTTASLQLVVPAEMILRAGTRSGKI